MNPGLELDRIVAEKVMGWTQIEENHAKHIGQVQLVGIDPKPKGLHHPNPHKTVVPKYSTEIKAAWEVAAFLRANGGHCLLLWEDSAGWTATFGEDDDLSARKTAEAAPHAICLAALKAIKETP